MGTVGNILFLGVGGQGVLLASEITAYALLETGVDVKKSEVHGMAMRGGLVVAHLRYGVRVYSPVISPGEADIAVAFEKMEAVRYLPYYHPDTRVIVNTHQILPPVVAAGKMAYPENIVEELITRRLVVTTLNAFEVARAVGEIRCANIVMVGVLSTMLPVVEEVFLEVMRKRIPQRFLEVNLKAFAEGRKLGGE